VFFPPPPPYTFTNAVLERKNKQGRNKNNKRNANNREPLVIPLGRRDANTDGPNVTVRFDNTSAYRNPDDY